MKEDRKYQIILILFFCVIALFVFALQEYQFGEFGCWLRGKRWDGKYCCLWENQCCSWSASLEKVCGKGGKK